MTTPTAREVTVTVPPETYEHFRSEAERSQRSVEEVMAHTMRAAQESAHSTAAERKAMLAAVEAIDTATLWQIVQRGAETEGVLLLSALNEKRHRDGLTPAEEAAAQSLIREHDRAVLLRAKALAVLRQRGEDVRPLVANP